MAYNVGNPGPGLEQGYKCGGLNPFMFLILNSNKGVVIYDCN
jgi:hypothetical protein